MEAYRRKIAYQNQAAVEEYLGKFKDPQGRMEDEATTAALAQALNMAPEIERILDMPCGTGRYTQFFCDRGYRYVGADVSQEMMEALVHNRKDSQEAVTLIRCDCEHLPFKENAFDCVMCIRFLNHHIPPSVRARMAREMWRVSKRWLIVQSHRLKPLGPFTSIKVFVRKIFGFDTGKYSVRREIIGAGWKEEYRIPIQGKRFYLGVYRK